MLDEIFLPAGGFFLDFRWSHWREAKGHAWLLESGSVPMAGSDATHQTGAPLSPETAGIFQAR